MLHGAAFSSFGKISELRNCSEDALLAFSFSPRPWPFQYAVLYFIYLYFMQLFLMEQLPGYSWKIKSC
jgi:hypothetical protein